MVKIYSESVTIPWKIIFEESLKKGISPEIWKNANVVPLHTKKDKALIKKTLIKDYRPISLLSVFGKIFERVIYNFLFNYFLSNKLFTPSQSCDSIIAQLLSIINETQTTFDKKPTVNVRGVFLDISKAFDKVWHDGLIFKLKSFGAEGELLLLIYFTFSKTANKELF